jgi:hypothetical protein
MTAKQLINLLSYLDPDMPLDGVKVTKNGLVPLLQDKPVYTAVAAFWGAFCGIGIFASLLALISNL